MIRFRILRFWLASLAALVGFILLPGAAKADFVTFTDPNNGGSASINNITFATGNTVVVGGANVTVGSLITTYYQANLSGTAGTGTQFSQNSTLGLIGPGGVDSHAFITGVLGVQEIVTGLSTNVAGITTATFGLAPGVNYLDIYVNSSGSGNNSTGMGFNFGAGGGTDILHAAVTTITSNYSEAPTPGNAAYPVPFNTSGFPSPTYVTGTPSSSVGQPTTTGTQPGSGSFTIDAQILSVNNSWFPGLSPSTMMDFIIPSGNLKDSFSSVAPSALFQIGPNGGPVTNYTPNPGNVNGLPLVFGGTGVDEVDQTDASAGFTISSTTAVPEPASLTLLALGSLSLIGGAWRVRRKKARNAGTAC